MKKITFSLFLILILSTTLFSKNYIGQRFILTLPNNTNPNFLSSWLEKTKPAGIMLQSKHFKNRDKTKALVNFLQNTATKIGIPKLLIAVDWEGGIVSRPNEQGGFFSIPSPRNLYLSGKTYTFLAGKLIGQQMRSVGININFAPSLDLFDKNNPILATRTFSKNPKKVLEFGQTFAKGLKSENIIPVFKHFPGLGFGKKDTHFSQTKIDLSKNEIYKNIYPFEQILNKKKCCIMVSHAKYPNLFGNIPTTLSSKAVTWIKKRNKNAILITDDFCMRASRAHKTLEKNIISSLKAGYHLLIFSGTPEEQIKLILSLEKQMQYLDKKDLDNFEKISKEITSFKKIFFNKIKPKIFLINEKQLGKTLTKKSIQVDFKRGYKKTNNDILITADLPKVRTNEKWFINNKQSYLYKKLIKLKLNLEEIIFNPLDEKTIDNIVKTILNRKNKNIILQTFFYGDGPWNENQKNILKKLKPFQNQISVISLGHPYEKNILPNANILNLGSFHKPLLKEGAKRLVSKKFKNNFAVSSLKKNLDNKKFGLLCCSASFIKNKNKKEFLPDFLYNWAKSLNNKTELKALFSPEHGILGKIERCENIQSKQSSKWSCPIYSLYGENKQPTKKMIENLDLLLIDLHDVGLRCFTYLSSLKLAMEAAAESSIPVVVINHPNPIYFWKTCGPKLENNFHSIVGMIDIPFLHNKTIGKIAKEINKEIKADLKVINCLPKIFWKKYFKQENFISPSPNLSTLESVYTYPLTVFLEGTNYSEGRGTKYSFQQFGAPWINAKKLAKELNSKKLPGIYFEASSFTPSSIKNISSNPKHKNKKCFGTFIHFYDIKKVKPIKTAFTILDTLFKLYPEKSEWLKFSERYFIDLLVGNSSWREKIAKSLEF